MKNLFLAALLLSVCLSPVRSQQLKPSGDSINLSPAEIAALIEETGTKTTRMSQQLYNYSYLQTDEEFEVDKSGKAKAKNAAVYEVMLVSVGNRSRRVLVQISEDGVPLDAEKIERQRERIAKQLLEDDEKAKSQPPPQVVKTSYVAKFWSYGIKTEKHSGLSKTYWYVSPTAFLLSHEFYAPRRTVFNDREAIVLNFRPRPDYKFDNTNVPFKDGIEDYGNAMLQLGGTIWIDAADKVITRLEAVPVRELNSAADASAGAIPNENVPLGFELMRLPEGVWVPKRSWYNSYGRESVFWKTSISRSEKFSDFKLFKSSVEKGEVNSVQNKP